MEKEILLEDYAIIPFLLYSWQLIQQKYLLFPS